MTSRKRLQVRIVGPLSKSGEYNCGLGRKQQGAHRRVPQTKRSKKTKTPLWIVVAHVPHSRGNIFASGSVNYIKVGSHGESTKKTCENLLRPPEDIIRFRAGEVAHETHNRLGSLQDARRTC